MPNTPAKSPHFINCHTHIFIGENIPPYIAKTFLPWPLYYLLSIRFVLAVCKFWYTSERSPKQWKYKWWYKKWQRIFYAYRSFIKRHLVSRLIVLAINT